MLRPRPDCFYRPKAALEDACQPSEAAADLEAWSPGGTDTAASLWGTPQLPANLQACRRVVFAPPIVDSSPLRYNLSFCTSSIRTQIAVECAEPRQDMEAACPLMYEELTKSTGSGRIDPSKTWNCMGVCKMCLAQQNPLNYLLISPCRDAARHIRGPSCGGAGQPAKPAGTPATQSSSEKTPSSSSCFQEMLQACWAIR